MENFDLNTKSTTEGEVQEGKITFTFKVLDKDVIIEGTPKEVIKELLLDAVKYTNTSAIERNINFAKELCRKYFPQHSSDLEKYLIERTYYIKRRSSLSGVELNTGKIRIFRCEAEDLDNIIQ